jgi:N6-L-threonylcarbamoyladenine synthase
LRVNGRFVMEQGARETVVEPSGWQLLKDKTYGGTRLLQYGLAEGADDRAVAFTMPRIKDGSPDFSFSGIKTAVLLHVRREGIVPVADPDDVPREVRDLVASFQRTVVSTLVRGLVKGAEAHGPRSLLLTGGVAANSRLRRDTAAAAARLGLPLFVPPLDLTTDNAAMIAAAGFVSLRRGVTAGWDLNAEPQLRLDAG